MRHRIFTKFAAAFLSMTVLFSAAFPSFLSVGAADSGGFVDDCLSLDAAYVLRHENLIIEAGGGYKRESNEKKTELVLDTWGAMTALRIRFDFDNGNLDPLDGYLWASSLNEGVVEAYTADAPDGPYTKQELTFTRGDGDKGVIAVAAASGRYLKLTVSEKGTVWNPIFKSIEADIEELSYPLVFTDDASSLDAGYILDRGNLTIESGGGYKRLTNTDESYILLDTDASMFSLSVDFDFDNGGLDPLDGYLWAAGLHEGVLKACTANSLDGPYTEQKLTFTRGGGDKGVISTAAASGRYLKLTISPGGTVWNPIIKRVSVHGEKNITPPYEPNGDIAFSDSCASLDTAYVLKHENLTIEAGGGYKRETNNKDTVLLLDTGSAMTGLSLSFDYDNGSLDPLEGYLYASGLDLGVLEAYTSDTKDGPYTKLNLEFTRGEGDKGVYAKAPAGGKYLKLTVSQGGTVWNPIVKQIDVYGKKDETSPPPYEPIGDIVFSDGCSYLDASHILHKENLILENSGGFRRALNDKTTTLLLDTSAKMSGLSLAFDFDNGGLDPLEGYLYASGLGLGVLEAYTSDTKDGPYTKLNLEFTRGEGDKGVYAKAPAGGRYLKLTVSQGGTVWNPILKRIDVYGEEAGGDPTLPYEPSDSLSFTDNCTSTVAGYIKSLENLMVDGAKGFKRIAFDEGGFTATAGVPTSIIYDTSSIMSDIVIHFNFDDVDPMAGYLFAVALGWGELKAYAAADLNGPYTEVPLEFRTGTVADLTAFSQGGLPEGARYLKLTISPGGIVYRPLLEQIDVYGTKLDIGEPDDPTPADPQYVTVLDDTCLDLNDDAVLGSQNLTLDMGKGYKRITDTSASVSYKAEGPIARLEIRFVHSDGLAGYQYAQALNPKVNTLRAFVSRDEKGTDQREVILRLEQGEAQNEILATGNVDAQDMRYLRLTVSEKGIVWNPIITRVTAQSPAVKITFKAEDHPDVERYTYVGGPLNDIPSVPKRAGLEGWWSVQDFTAVKQDMVVYAVYGEKTPDISPDTGVGAARLWALIAAGLSLGTAAVVVRKKKQLRKTEGIS